MYEAYNTPYYPDLHLFSFIFPYIHSFPPFFPTFILILHPDLHLSLSLHFMLLLIAVLTHFCLKFYFVMLLIVTMLLAYIAIKLLITITNEVEKHCECRREHFFYHVLAPINTFNRLQPQAPPVLLKRP